MAKKKKASTSIQQDSVMDITEKLCNLKSLNQMLLKETFERRQQVDSLIQSQGCLELELTRSNSELSENAVSLELEKSVVYAFIAVQVRQSMEDLEKEVRGLKIVIDGKMFETGILERKVMETEYASRNETRRMEMERDSVERSLVDLNKLVGETKEELYRTSKEKEGVEVERNVEMVKRIELEKLVSDLQKKSGKLRVKLSELENESAKSEERRKEMEKEIAGLVEERKDSKKSFERLIGEKDVVEKNLVKAMNQLDDERRKVEESFNENKMLRESELGLVHEVNILRNHAAERTAFVLRLEKSYKAMESRSIELSSEFRECKYELDQVKAERDEIRNCLDKEKLNGVKLKERMENIGKKLEESVKVAMEAKAENGAISVEKMNLESQKREIDNRKMSLVEAQNESSPMNVNIVSTDSKSELVANKLKGAATFCSNGEIDTCEHINSEETMANAMEFELIKNAFKCKEAKIDSMKKQLKFLQNSVEVADKKKCYWTVLSSATTLLAAVSLAYAARRRSFW